MISAIAGVQSWITLALGVALFAVEAFAAIDAATRAPVAYQRADKRTKGFWAAVTGVAAVLGFLSIFNVLTIFSIIAIVGAGVYLADVRPAVKRYGGGSSLGRSSSRW